MNFKRLIALALAFVFSLSITGIVFAADEPWAGMAETSVIDKPIASSGITDEEGLFKSVETPELLKSDYIKMTYTVNGNVSSDTSVFILKTYNTVYEGWNETPITIGESTLSNGVYTVYLSVADVKKTLSSGTLKGINAYFVINSAYETTLTGYYYVAPAKEEMTVKKWLKKSIDYCKELNSSKYQSGSWSSFLPEIEKAEAVYNNTSASDTDYQNARDNLQKAKSKLLFVNSTENASPMEFKMLSGEETVYEMGAGWNLGNTLDGHSGFHPGETVWQKTITTKELIKKIHDTGFNTIRVPVTWGDMIDDEKGYAINEEWISRVQDIVDYCTEMDMYTIINIHHDGADGWLSVGADDIDAVYEKFECVWRNIAERFKDYDEHLIFESANELTCTSHSSNDKNSDAAQKKDTPIIMNLNQIFVNVVRSTGSNNTKRWLASVSHFANRGTGYGFVMPTDSYNSTNRQMFAHHVYKQTNSDTYDWTKAKELVDVIKDTRKKVNTFKDIPIIMGEYGTRNRAYSQNPSGYNDIGRAYYFECAARAGQVGMTVPCVWDQGSNKENIYETGTYTIWDRNNNEPIFKSITDAMMRGIFLPATAKNNNYDMSDIVQNPEIKPITELTVDKNEVEITYGDSIKLAAEAALSDTNDVILWKSDDDSIATVYRGLIQGNKIGTTYVTAFSQSGSAEKRIKVTVMPRISENSAKTIITEKESYRLVKGKSTMLKASADTGESLIYSSSNDMVATVNRQGKIVAKSAGTAYITIMAESGITKTVTVTVTESEGNDSIEIALNVYYNDSKYNGNEVGIPITVTEDGQYKLTFDTKTDLSDKAKKAGIGYLKNMVSIYIKDNVNTVKTPLDSCEIRYDSIKVNDSELTITKGDFKSALKADNIFDTNDPVNGWDGSAVKEVTVDKNHVLNFTSVENPTKIEVVFTFNNMKFTKPVSEEKKEVISITAENGNDVSLNKGNVRLLKAAANPVDSTSLVSFISSDESVVIVDDKAKKAENGVYTAEIKGIGKGKATIKAIADNGVYEIFNINVTELPFSNVEGVTENGKITGVKANMNYKPEYDKISVIAAVYNSNGVLQGEEVKEIPVTEITGNTLNVNGFSLEVKSGSIFKTFIWNNCSDMIPLSDYSQ